MLTHKARGRLWCEPLMLLRERELQIENCKSRLIRSLGKTMTPEELSDRLWRFAARVGKVVDALPETRLGRHVAGQLVRCGTSAPPNYDEASCAESRRDFIHKLKIALKEQKEMWARMAPLHNHSGLAAEKRG